MNRLAGDIMGDLRGIVANLRNNPNFHHRLDQRAFEDVLITALRAGDIGNYNASRKREFN